MKNRFIKIIFLITLCLNFFEFSHGEDFIFNVTEIEIEDNGNLYKGINKGKITTDNQIEIISNNFKYLKKANSLEVNGDVILTDFKNDIIINAEKIFYLKSDEIIYTIGKTKVSISDKYIVNGHDLTLFRNKMILSSEAITTISDTEANIYELNEFEYSIDEEILKGKKIEVTTNFEKSNSDKYFFEDGFFNLKENKFLGKDVNIKFHKSLFDDSKNDPRINSLTSYGDQQNTYFDKGVFTSCKKTDKCPPWKITSEEIHHDKIKKQINYKNAWLNVYDVPVVYFPRFFHPDPTVKRQSGFLSPGLGSSKNTGNSISTPYFYLISEDKDLTIKPQLFDNNKFLLQNEYRQKTKKTLSIVDFGFVNGHDSSTSDKGGTRSHIFTKSIIDLSLDDYSYSTLKIDYQKASNDNYLKIFNLESPILPSSNDVLESAVKLDLEHEDYDLTTSLEMYETLKGSNSDRYQYVLPSYNFNKNFYLESLTSGLNFNSYGNNTLKDTNVTESTLINDLNYSTLNNFFDNGVRTNFDIFLKNVNTAGKNNPKYEESPQSELMSSYTYNMSLPMVKKTQTNFNTLEPKLSLKLSPHDMKNNKALERRIDINNIFNSNRLSMNDSFEGGESITLGLNFKKEKIKKRNSISEIEEYIDFKLASVFRFNEEKNIPTKSTLNKKKSNIFGEFNYKPIKNILLGYNFSLTEDLNTFEYNSLITKIGFKNFTTQFDYLEERGVIGDANVIENKTEYNFNDANFISFNTRRNRKLDLTEYYNLIYEYKNDCLVAGIKYKKNYYNDGDIKPTEELFFSITIVPLASFSPSKMALK